MSVLAQGACVDLPEIRYETEHLRIGTHFDAPLPHVYGGSVSMLAKRELIISERGLYAITTTAEGGLIARCQDEDYDEIPSRDEPEARARSAVISTARARVRAARSCQGRSAPATAPYVVGRY